MADKNDIIINLDDFKTSNGNPEDVSENQEPILVDDLHEEPVTITETDSIEQFEDDNETETSVIPVTNTVMQQVSESFNESTEKAQELDYVEQPINYLEESDNASYEEARPKKKGKTALIILGVLISILLLGVAAFFGLRYFFTPNQIVNEVVEVPSTLAFCCYDNDTTHGDLYYCLPNKERIKIDSNVLDYSYILMSKTQTVYYTKGENDFYYCEPGKKPVYIGKDMWIDPYVSSEDQNTVLLYQTRSVEEHAEFDLYIIKDGKEKEKIANSVYSYRITDDGKTVYFLEDDDDLYKWTEEDGKEKIDDSVSAFEVSTDALYYDTYSKNDNYEFNKTYVKLSTSESLEKFHEEFSYVSFSKDGLFMLYLTDVVYDEDRGEYGELYMYAGGDDEIKIASDVQLFILTEDCSKIFYFTADEILYVRELPKVTDSTYKDIDKYKEELGECEKTRLGNKVDHVQISPDGNSIMYTNENGTLYLCVTGEERVKIANKVSLFTISNNHFVYLNEEGELYANSKYRDVKNISKNTEKIDDDITYFLYTDLSQYVAYYKKGDNRVYILGEDGKRTVIHEKTDIYDVIHFNNNQIYRKELALTDIAGMYYISENGSLFEIIADDEYDSIEGKVYSYGTGEEEEFKIESGYSESKYELSVYFYKEDEYYGTCTFKVDESGNVQIVSGYGEDTEYYVPECMNREDFDEKIKEIADEKLKEIKSEQMYTLAREYYYDGYYVSSEDTLYSDKNFDSALDITYATSGEKYVYSYYVDLDNEIIWLKLHIYDSETYTTSDVWVPVEYVYVPEEEY